MFYYYGAKHSNAHRYPAPKHDLIVEPFAGSAGYAVYHLIHGNADRAILVEKDPRVVALWHRLLAMTPDEVRSIPIPAIGEKTDDFFVMTAATGNAVAKCRQMTVTSRMPRIVEFQKDRVAVALAAIGGRVEVIEGDYSIAPDVEATWFIDPPYQVQPLKGNSAKTVWPQGQGYRPGCQASDLDFIKLAEWCKAREGQVLVAEQRGADWLPFLPMLGRSKDSQGRRKQEMLWTNGTASAADQVELWTDEATA